MGRKVGSIGLGNLRLPGPVQEAKVVTTKLSKSARGGILAGWRQSVRAMGVA